MLTKTATAERISIKRDDVSNVKYFYSPEIDDSGKIFWKKMTMDELMDDIIEEDKKENKTYTTEEVRQNLEKRFGFKIGRSYQV